MLKIFDNNSPTTKSNYLWCFTLGSIIGSLIFIGIWGLSPLNPHNIKWIFNPYGSDFSFTGIASLQFITSEWAFPLGATDGLLYPSRTSVIFFDGVPIAAIIAKIIHSFYQHDFQYFGIWGIFCMAVQGGLAALIIRRYSPNLIITTLSSAFFCLAPFLLGKMFGHPSMSGQFILLLPLLFIWYRDSQWVEKNQLLLWTSTSAISVSIVIYFTPMVFLLMVLYYALLAQESGIAKNIRRFLFTFIASATACIIVMWLLGGFLPNHESSSSDYGIAPLNLNSLFNPSWASKTIQALPDATGSGEGYAWLGLGVILGGVFLVAHSLLYSTNKPQSLIKRYSPYFVASIILIAFAATNKIVVGNHLIFSYQLPEKFLSLLSIFRTSGRFIWPVWFLIVIFIIGRISALPVNTWRKATLIALLLCIQVADGSNYINKLNRTSELQDSPPLSSPFWGKLAELQIKHVVFLPFSGRVSHEAWAYISAQAVQQKATTNTYWLGRYPMKEIQGNINSKIADLQSGIFNKEELYIINYIPLLTNITFSEGLNAYLIDNQVVLGRDGLQNEKDGARKIVINRINLADYLNKIKKLDPGLSIAISARQDSTPVNLDDTTHQELSSLKISEELQGSSDFTYLSIFETGNGILFEKISKESIDLKSSYAPILKGNAHPFYVDISIANSFGSFPKILIDDIDCSHNFVGMNICIYDSSSRKILEVASFDLYTMSTGVYIDMR